MRVQIKTWDEMLVEFGASLIGSENTILRLGFIESMEKRLPDTRIIEVSKTPVLEEDDFTYYLWDGFYVAEPCIEKFITIDDYELDEKDDYIQNLEFENKNMAEFLESLGYNQEQISNIALSGCLNLE